MTVELKADVTFQYIGIGDAIQQYRLSVPVNQRDYAWEDRHVRDLFHDLTQARDENQPIYFLGTIVLTGQGNEIPQVADGQQRLATTTILLAAIRDFIWRRGENERERARAIEYEYIRRYDIEAKDTLPRFSLNVSDNDFFQKRILSAPDSSARAVTAVSKSHRKIATAAEIAAQHVLHVVAAYSEKNQADHLVELVTFIRHAVKVIVLKVPDPLNAFRMFETLNDRGLKTSQFDILKNHLFGAVGDRIKEAQQRWSAMTSVLESVGDDDLSLDYLRHLVITRYGHTREKEIFDKIRETISGRTAAIEFLGALSENASDYIATMNPYHAKWNSYPSHMIAAIKTINTLGVKQLRPLMLAVARNFVPKEAARTYRAIVSWIVRLLIVGGGRSESVEKVFSACAHEITQGKINNLDDLFARVSDVVPPDKSFETEFSTARVSRSLMARYYLRSLETQQKDMPEPEFVPNEDSVINLEHVLPQNPGPGWSTIDAETADAYYDRIGNLALLQASVNSRIGNENFATKKPHLAASSYELTSMMSENDDWGVDEIKERQQKLAKLAVKTWPLKR